jgi:hypothetical protein
MPRVLEEQMTENETEVFQHLRRQLAVDLLDIDKHLVEQPQWQMDAAEYAATAAQLSQEADDILEITKAHAGSRLREVSGDAKKLTEAQLKMDILLEEDVIDAISEATSAKRDLAMWRALVDSLKSKASVMKTAAELINSGYLAPKAAVEGNRAGLSKAREANKK